MPQDLLLDALSKPDTSFSVTLQNSVRVTDVNPCETSVIVDGETFEQRDDTLAIKKELKSFARTDVEELVGYLHDTVLPSE
jgi:hypothetical protein